MIVLDASVISELIRPKPETPVLAWPNREEEYLDLDDGSEVYEIRCGLLVMSSRQKSSALASEFERWLSGTVERRILRFR